MKKVRFILCAVMALVLFSCEKEIPQVPERQYPDYSTEIISPEIKQDFLERYPEAKVQSAFEKGKYHGVTFIDGDGLRKDVVYKERWLVLTATWLNVNDFLSQLPSPVLGTYLATGIKNEYFGEDDDPRYYVVEVKRAGIEQKQYEIHCSATFMDGGKEVEDVTCHLVISEDGTLVTCQHAHFLPTRYTYDCDAAVEAVRKMYNCPEILGFYNEMGSYDRIVIRDKGVVKTVSFYSYDNEFEWTGTRYSLHRLTMFPEYLLKVIEEGDAKHPERKLFDVFIFENQDGKFYGLTFGSELNNSTIYVKIK